MVNVARFNVARFNVMVIGLLSHGIYIYLVEGCFNLLYDFAGHVTIGPQLVVQLISHHEQDHILKVCNSITS